MITSYLVIHLGLIVGYILAILASAHMLRHRRSPAATMAWLMAFILLPYVGVALYLMFGNRKIRSSQDATRPIPAANIRGAAYENELCSMLQQYGIAPP